MNLNWFYNRTRTLFPALILFTSLLTSSLGTPDSFEITIREEAGIPRHSEPVQVSLPFAAGQLEDGNGICIRDAAGSLVAAQCEPLARWDDGSIRWLLARFLVDLPAEGATSLTVQTSVDPDRETAPNLATEDNDNLLVDTGEIRASLGPAGRETFLPTDGQNSPLLTAHPSFKVYSPSGKVHHCNAPDTVELEENGPLYASVFLAGNMEAEEPEFSNIFRYETRLHFWRDLGRVLAEHTVIAAGAAEKGGITIVDGIVLDGQTPEGFDSYVISGSKEAHDGDLNEGDRLRLKQTCAYWHEAGRGADSSVEPIKYVVLEEDFGYELTDGTGEVLSKGEKSPGWMWASGGERSLGVAVRDFWEEGPKALSLGADGSFSVECYAHWRPKPGEDRPPRFRTPDFSKDPRLDDWFKGGKDIEERVRLFLEDTEYEGPVRRGPFRFGKGRAKTTDVLYLFGNTEDRQKEIDTLSARRHYLVPVVDPKYLASTRALPFLWTASSEIGMPTMSTGIRAMFENWKKHATRYGFLHFGDDQCAFGYNRTVPATTDDQEYDTTQGLTTLFGSTGETDYLRWANICSRHFMDVDQVHPSGELNFHGYDAHSDYHEEPGVIDMNGHPYISGIVNHYMLTGDRRSLRGIKRLATALKRYGEGARERVLQTDGRSLARPGVCLSAIYDLTRDPADLEPAKQMVAVINDLADDPVEDLKGDLPFRMWWLHHSEMCYHVREVLARYHAATGDERTLATLQKAADRYLHNLWDGEREAWRGFLGAPHDYNDFYMFPVAREGRSQYTLSGYAAAEIGMPFAYLAGVAGDTKYLIPFLDYLDNIGTDYAYNFGNRRFARRLLWSLPFVSMLPADWRKECDSIVQRETFHASLKKEDALSAWTPEGEIQGTAHGEILWATGLSGGDALRTYDRSFASFPAPEDILELPGTLSFWVRKDAAHWDRKPWPWYGETRGLVHIGSATLETNALDIMMWGSDLWVRLYDHRGWETVGLSCPSPFWEKGEWHHVAVVWNRFNLTVYVNGAKVGSEDRMSLPNGGQSTVYIGWRPTNRYGQADFRDLRIFRSPLPGRRIKKIHESGCSEDTLCSGSRVR